MLLGRRLLHSTFAARSQLGQLRGFARDGADAAKDKEAMAAMEQRVADDPGNMTAALQHPSAMMIAGNEVGKTVINVTVPPTV